MRIDEKEVDSITAEWVAITRIMNEHQGLAEQVAGLKSEVKRSRDVIETLRAEMAAPNAKSPKKAKRDA